MSRAGKFLALFFPLGLKISRQGAADRQVSAKKEGFWTLLSTLVSKHARQIPPSSRAVPVGIHSPFTRRELT